MAGDLMARVDDYDGATVTAVCDVNGGAAEAAAHSRDAAAVTDHEELFDDHDFEAVFIAIPRSLTPTRRFRRPTAGFTRSSRNPSHYALRTHPRWGPPSTTQAW